MPEPASFSLFSSLPRELRHQIWTNALPLTNEPALFFYTSGYWRVEYRHHPPRKGDELIIRFRHDLLPKIEVKAPLFHVCKESRWIVLGWFRRQGISTRYSAQTGTHMFVRSFDITCDTLYVSHQSWRGFYYEACNLSYRKKIYDVSYERETLVTRIAVPLTVAIDETGDLDNIASFVFRSLKNLFYVLDAPEPPCTELYKDGNNDIQSWWTLKDVWNDCDEATAKLIDEARRQLEYEYGENFDELRYSPVYDPLAEGAMLFRPAFAVRDQ